METIDLKERPDLAKKLEKYGLIPSGTEQVTREELNKLIEGVEEKIEDKKKAHLDIPNHGNVTMLKNLTQVALVGTTTVASLLANAGLGILPEREENEIKRARLFSFEVVLHLVIGSELLTTLFRQIASTVDTSVKNQELIAEILRLTAILMAILAASKGNQDTLEGFTLNAAPEILKGLEKVEEFVNESFIAGTVEEEKAKEIALYLNQARIALKKEHFDGFFAAYNGALGLIGLDHELVVKDIKELEAAAERLSEALTMSQEDEAITAMSQAM